MHLNGDLTDFALADILQILSLGRKTGTLLVENGSVKGRIIIEDGRITGAEAHPGGSLAEGLVRRGKLDPQTLAQLRRIGATCAAWSFPSLLLESGLLGSGELENTAVLHTTTLVARLVEIGKGSFRLLLNETAFADEWENVRLAEGLDIGEVLLQSATKRDEAQRRGEPAKIWSSAGEHSWVANSPAEASPRKNIAAGPNYKSSEHHKTTTARLAGKTANGDGANGHGAADKNGHGHQRTERFYALLAELGANSALVEISLLLMRYASEMASRGVLFGIHAGELHGIGQFGVDRFVHGQNIDSLIRAIRLPLTSDALVAQVVRERAPVVGPLEHSYWNAEMLGAIGGGHDGLQALAVPLLRNGEVMYVIYADNFGSSEPLMALDELIALMSVTTLALDKTLLEQLSVGAQAS
jgi:Domain of unknown function (DUF4388)